MNDIILSALTETPQTATAIAAKTGKPVSTIRKWLRALRKAGSIAYEKIKGVLHYTVKMIRKVIRTREEIHALCMERAETHRQRLVAATTPQEKRLHRRRLKRAKRRAAATAAAT